VKALLIGGPFDRVSVDLKRHPNRIEVAGVFYELITDPDTGEGLGAYVVSAT